MLCELPQRYTNLKNKQMLKQLLEGANRFFTSQRGILVTSATLISLFSLKLYFRGGVCKVDRDLTGKVIVVTGANTGIGKSTIQVLAGKKCIIFFGARDHKKSLKAIEDIKAKISDAKISCFELDLQSMDSIKKFSENVKNQCQKIDILINNAGVMAIPQRHITANGFQMQMGVNHLGHFYLTHLLWDKIKKVQDFRIINVSSTAHQGFGFPKKDNFQFDISDLNMIKQTYTGGIAYSRSKAANILFTRELQRKITEKGSQGIAVSLHPGVVRTQLGRYFSLTTTIIAKGLLAPIYFLLLKSPMEGAQTTLYTVLEESNRLEKGGYYKDCKLQQSTKFTQDMANAALLWKKSQQVLGIQFDV